MTGRSIQIAGMSHVGEARRIACEVARGLSFPEELEGAVGLIVTEAAANIAKHAGEGEILVHAADSTVEILALDKGPGMEHVARCMEDGYSTAGTRGIGLGGITRLATSWDIFSLPGSGTALFATVAARHRHGAGVQTNGYRPGGICIPIRGESVCGDSWWWRMSTAGVRLVVADGLGHGPNAADASSAAVEIAESHPGMGLKELLNRMHAGLRSTRGAAVTLADLDWEGGMATVVGIGNVGGAVVADSGSRRQMVTMNGTAGVSARTIQEFQYELEPSSAVVLYSDGLATHWSLTDYAGLCSKHPTLMAGVLYRDFKRGKDDVTVVVARRPPRSS